MKIENDVNSENSKYLFLDIDGVINSAQSNMKYAKQWNDSPQEFKDEVLGYMKEQMELIQESGFRYGKLHLARARSVEKFGIGVEGGTKPDPKAMVNLNSLCEEIPDLNIIISSTWRVNSTIDELREIFRLWGLQNPERIIGKTADSYDRPRSDEILEWLSENGFQYENLISESNMVILDDMENMGRLTPCLVKTDADVGFSGIDRGMIMKIFNI